MGHIQRFSLDHDGCDIREVDADEVLVALDKIWQRTFARQSFSIALQIIVRSYVWYYGAYSDPRQGAARWLRICRDFRDFIRTGELPHYVIWAYARLAVSV